MAHYGCQVPQTLRPGVRAELSTKVLSLHPLITAVPPPRAPPRCSVPAHPPAVSALSPFAA